MLQTLRVRNLALVEDISVEFGPGLNIITGETGAGKSVLVGALGLVLGERADRNAIRAGASQASVEASFNLTRPDSVNHLLSEHGLAACAGGELLLRRIIAPSGNRTFINDAPVTLHVLAQLGTLLVDMHGPHEHQSLLQQEFQLELLDAFGDHAQVAGQYAGLYRDWRALQERRRALEGDDADVAQRIDLLKFQIQEIEAAAVKPGEDEEILREHALVSNARRILELAGSVRTLLNGEEASVFVGLAAANRALDELVRLMPDARTWHEQAQALAVQARELEADIARAVEKIEHDPGRLQWIEERLDLYQKLKRKYRPTVAEILAFYDEAKSTLAGLENRDAELAALGAKIEAARRALEQAGKKLGAERRATAARMAKAVTVQLRDLGFASGAFNIGLVPIEPGPSGMDQIDFSFAPNVGEPPRPLRAIASSGEISRVMLALKGIMAGHDRIPVLVFDEIDVNIGGEMGHAVGRKLRAVADHHQVLCITHLPQVAVHGAIHHAVRKEVSGGRTFTRIAQLAAAARVEEIARMLGGRDSASGRKHAAALLAQAG